MLNLEVLTLDFIVLLKTKPQHVYVLFLKYIKESECCLEVARDTCRGGLALFSTYTNQMWQPQYSQGRDRQIYEFLG